MAATGEYSRTQSKEQNVPLHDSWCCFNCSSGTMSSWFGTLMSVMVSPGFLFLWRSSGHQTSSCMSCEFSSCGCFSPLGIKWLSCLDGCMYNLLYWTGFHSSTSRSYWTDFHQCKMVAFLYGILLLHFCAMGWNMFCSCITSKMNYFQKLKWQLHHDFMTLLLYLFLYFLLTLLVWMTMFPRPVLMSTWTTQVTSAGTEWCDLSQPATWRSLVFPSMCRTAHSHLAPTCTPVRKCFFYIIAWS